MAEKYTSFSHYTLFKRGEKYYFYTYLPGGKRVKRSTGRRRKDEALKMVHQYFAERDLRDVTFRQYAAPYFTEACPRTLRRRAEGKAMGNTHVAKSRSWLKKAIELCPEFADKLIHRIDRGDVLDLRARLHQLLPGKTNTVNKLTATIKTVLSEAAFRGDIKTDPGAKVGTIEYEQRQRGVLAASEVREILEKKPGQMATSPLVDLVVALLFTTGLRIGEARALRWGSIDLDTGRCLIREAFKDGKEIGLPKWNKSREIILPLVLLKRLQGGDPDEFVLSEGGGPPVGITWLRNAFKRVLIAAELREDINFTAGDRWLTPHAARHTLNTALLAAEVSPLLVQTFLGWSSAEARALTNIQRQYSHLELLRLEDVAQKIDELYGPPKEQVAEA